MMRQRSTASWIAVGALAVVGGFWLTTRVFQLLYLHGGWIPFAGHFIGALLAGATMVAHAALRPWREPVAAGVVAVGILAILFLVLPQPWFSWVAARSTYPWLMALAIAGVTAAGALCGAVIARRVTTTAPHPAKLLLLGALTITGCTITALHFAGGSGLVSEPRSGLLVGLMLLAIVFGGSIVQLMVTIYRPWTICGGAMLFALTTFGETGFSADTAKALGTSLLFGGIAAIGARLARRWVPPADAAHDEPLPPARLH